MATNRRPPTPTHAPSNSTTVRLTLTGPYAGQHVTVRGDRIRRKHFRAIEEAEPSKQTLLLFDIIELVAVEWDLLDVETGVPLPQPGDGGGDELAADQLKAIYAVFNEHYQAATDPPKP